MPYKLGYKQKDEKITHNESQQRATSKLTTTVFERLNYLECVKLSNGKIYLGESCFVVLYKKTL